MRIRSVPAILAVLLAVPAGAAEVERTDVTFGNDGLVLAGTVLVPAGGSAPGAVIIQGSGASGRGNRWAMSVAEALAGCGVAVLIPDKRGVGASGGDWQSADFAALAGDARAARSRLREQGGVDPARVGYLGLSQGGHVAPLAAATTPGAAFAANLVGSMQVMERQLYDELESAYREHGLDEATIAWLQEFARMSFDYVRSGEGFERYLARRAEIAAGPLARAAESWPETPEDPYWSFWRGIHDYDPIPWWRRVAEAGIPALVVYGADDGNVHVPSSVARLNSELPGAAITLRVYPDTGHSLRDPATGALRPDIVTDLCRWLHATPPRSAD